MALGGYWEAAGGSGGWDELIGCVGDVTSVWETRVLQESEIGCLVRREMI